MEEATKSSITAGIVSSLATALILGVLAYAGGQFQKSAIYKSLTGEIQVSESVDFHDVQKEAPIPNLSDWKFCSLTRVSIGTGGTCTVNKKDGKWVYQTGPAPNQQCSVTCWK
jgi:hypothetical protein